MNQVEAIRLIEDTLENVAKKRFDITIETDLIAEDILDSLDGMVFAMEIETAAQKKFPEDIDLVEAGYFKVEKLVTFLIA
jgi:acyl carrier protein